MSHAALKLVTLPMALALAVPAASANPTGPSVVAGSVNIIPNGSTLTIANTPGTIINWQNFSIGVGEVTQFNQQGASSAVLNRVTGANVSSIFGALQSNGRVFLVNPNGMLFGAGAQVTAHGFVATTLNIANDAFVAGNYSFNTAGDPGGISIQGATFNVPGFLSFTAPAISISGATIGAGTTLTMGNYSAVTLSAAGEVLPGSQLSGGSINITDSELSAPNILLETGGTMTIIGGDIGNPGLPNPLPIPGGPIIVANGGQLAGGNVTTADTVLTRAGGAGGNISLTNGNFTTAGGAVNPGGNLKVTALGSDGNPGSVGNITVAGTATSRAPTIAGSAGKGIAVATSPAPSATVNLEKREPLF